MGARGGAAGGHRGPVPGGRGRPPCRSRDAPCNRLAAAICCQPICLRSRTMSSAVAVRTLSLVVAGLLIGEGLWPLAAQQRGGAARADSAREPAADPALRALHWRLGGP